MKIKTNKKMNLPELINHVWKNKLYPTEIENDGGRFRVKFGQTALVTIIDCRGIEGRVDVPMDIIFTVEVEEELTEETEFSRLWSVFYNEDTKAPGTSRHNYLVTIDEVMGDDTYHEKKLLAIYHKDILIWSKDTGIPEEGVLEVER